MRWTECHICGIGDEVYREDKTVAKVFECWSCWKDYCENDGMVTTRICNRCLDEAYTKNDSKKVEGGF